MFVLCEYLYNNDLIWEQGTWVLLTGIWLLLPLLKLDNTLSGTAWVQCVWQIKVPKTATLCPNRKNILPWVWMMIIVPQSTKINIHVYIQCTVISVRMTFGIKCMWCLVPNHEHYTFLCTLYVIMLNDHEKLNSSAWEWD